MDERELLDALARVAREDRDLAGALEAGGRGPAAPPPAAPEAYLEVSRACRRLDRETKERIVERTLEQLPAAQAPGRSSGPSRLLRFPGPLARLRRGQALVAGSIAAAAGFLLVFGAPRTPPPLPSYDAYFSGGARATRAAAAPLEGDLALPYGSRFEVVLRPFTRVEGPLAARPFLLGPGAAKRLDLPVEISAEGSVRISGAVEELGAPPGRWELVIAVGRPASLPSAAQELADSSRSGSRALQIFRRTLIVVGGSPP